MSLENPPRARRVTAVAGELEAVGNIIFISVSTICRRVWLDTTDSVAADFQKNSVQVRAHIAPKRPWSFARLITSAV